VPEARLRSAEARESGRELFLANCALCHGERGDGHGRRSAGFAKAPANFTDPAWRRAATARRVFFAIREGLRGTPMPAWSTFSDDETWDLVAYVLSLGKTPAQ
jgi:high-affinity iron transporter